MGALSFWGGMAGAGQGIAGIGANMAASEERRIRDEREAQAREELQRERLQAQREAAELRASAARGSGGGAGRSGVSLADLAKNPELLSLSSGMSRAEVDDALAMSRGQDPMTPVAEDDGSGFSATEVPKYTPGQASALRERMTKSLYRAMGLNNPGQSDDLAKAERTAQGTGYAAEYRETGDERSGSAALINDSKPVNNDGTNVVSGKVTKGSLDAARIGAEGALAAKRNEERKTEVDKREGKGSIKDDLALVDGQRKKIDSRLSDIRAREASAMKMGDDEELAAAREERKKVQLQADALDAEYTRLTQKLNGGKPDAKKPDGGKASDSPPANLLKEGVNTKFKNGQVWTLRGGKPVKVS